MMLGAELDEAADQAARYRREITELKLDLDTAEEQANLYHAELEALTCDIELKSGQVLSAAAALRAVIPLLDGYTPFIEAINILATRIDEAREDLNL